jgi:hypothetical protein
VSAEDKEGRIFMGKNFVKKVVLISNQVIMIGAFFNSIGEKTKKNHTK